MTDSTLELIEKRLQEVRVKGFGEIKIVVHQNETLIETTFKEKVIMKK